MITLAVDAATSVGTVAVWRGDAMVAEASTPMRDRAVERLMPAIADALASAALGPSDIARVLCGAGPGSFTSLRIAGAIAKGLALGTGSGLHAVPSLALIVAAHDLAPGRYLAALDALRGEYYVSLLDRAADGTVAVLEPAQLAASESLGALATKHHATLVGPGQPLDLEPHARGARHVAGVHAVDLATWEPAYGRLAEAQVKWEAAHGRPLEARA